MCWAMGALDNYKDLDPDFRDRFLSYMKTACEQNKWSVRAGYPIPAENYMLGKDGMIYVVTVNWSHQIFELKFYPYFDVTSIWLE